MSRFTISPGVNVREVDLSNVIPAVSTSVAGFAGYFQWGPVGRVVSVSNAKQLAEIFGGPRQGAAFADYNRSFLTAESFLQYGNQLRVSRALSPAALSAVATEPGSTPLAAANELQIKGFDDFEDASIPADVTFVARYPGELGNSIDVIVTHADVHDTLADSDAKDIFNSVLVNEPETSPWAEAEGLENDEVSIVVIDANGKISGRRGEVLEVFENLSLEELARTADGQRNYVVDQVNETSRFIYINKSKWDSFFDKVAEAWTSQFYADSEGYNTTFEFDYGSNDDASVEGAIVEALKLFENDELIDISLIFGPSGGFGNQKVIDEAVIDIANLRRDCVAFVSAPITSTITNSATPNTQKTDEVLSYFEDFNSTSYAVFGSSPVYVYNRYIDEYQWIGSQGHLAGLCANTDNIADPWFSPAGLNRGHLRSIVKLAINPDKANRDDLYKNRINPIVSMPGQGILLYGDKTALSRPSALDRINVRRLLIVLQKAIATAAKFQLFELNDDITRTVFINSVEPFLREVQGRRGLTDFEVVCDETNNTPEVIDTNRFVGDIYIQPARSINFIGLNFVITRTGVDFAEIIGSNN